MKWDGSVGQWLEALDYSVSSFPHVCNSYVVEVFFLENPFAPFFCLEKGFSKQNKS